MKVRALAVLIGLLILPLLGLGVATSYAPVASASHSCEVRVWVSGQPTGPKFAVDPAQYPELCGAHTPTPAVPPTATPTATATATATATQTPAPPAVGWHTPTTHEHGDAPPQWVLDSGNPPFSQTRESHVGYKGVYDSSPGGAESYLIAHIISTVAARSHGDHDYQLWLRSPASGEVLYYEGVVDFGSPPPLRTSDTGERPIILSVGDTTASGGCETWYGRPGFNVMDVGWTICGRYARFDGTVLGGTGTGRTIDWLIPCSRLPAGTSLMQHCVTEYGVSRLSFIVNSRDYNGPSVVPVN